MTWFFGSFLVTPCALTSFHIVISKQASAIRAVSYNRCITRKRPCDENHAVGFRERRESQLSEGHSADQRCLWQACKGVEALAPPGSQKKIWEEEVLSLWVYFSPSISQLTTSCGLFSRIKWEIYFYKDVCFVCSLKS